MQAKSAMISNMTLSETLSSRGRRAHGRSRPALPVVCLWGTYLQSREEKKRALLNWILQLNNRSRSSSDRFIISCLPTVRKQKQMKQEWQAPASTDRTFFNKLNRMLEICPEFIISEFQTVSKQFCRKNVGNEILYAGIAGNTRFLKRKTVNLFDPIQSHP